MPVMDGFEAPPEIHRVAPSAKVIILSGFADETVRTRALQLSAHAYVTKGIPSPPRRWAAPERRAAGAREKAC